jgi:K+-transporting ATPase ATPase C chain
MAMTEVIKHIKPALMLLSIFTVLTGLLYPVTVTGLAQLLFPSQANGTLIQKAGENVGSSLIGQFFTDAKYFWGRPSATTSFPYNAASSSGSNLGPTNPELLVKVKERIAQLRKSDPQNHAPLPVDLVTASASGLDPEISPVAAFYQVPRVAKARGLTEIQVYRLVTHSIEGRSLNILGEPRVNVLKLNLALDALRN